MAWPACAWELEFFEGADGFRVGDIVEVRGGMLRRLVPECEDEWGGRYTGKQVARVAAIRHRLTGRRVATYLTLTSPLRAETADMGFCESPWGKHQKVQLLTVSDLLDGARVDMPPATGVNVMYKKARKSALGGSEQLDLTEQGE